MNIPCDASETLSFRMAELEDCELMAAWIVEASGGIMNYLLGGLLQGGSPEALVGLAVCDENATMGYPNILLAEISGEPAAALVGYDSTRYGLPDTLLSFVPRERVEGLGELMSSPLPPGFYLQTVIVSSSFRGAGLGGKLLPQAGLWASALGFSTLLLHVWQDNAPAIRLYEKSGFAVLQEVAIPERTKMGHEVNKWLMAKGLTGNLT
jgi:ribosomal protein S18 acetylase RimI-like enzyme